MLALDGIGGLGRVRCRGLDALERALRCAGVTRSASASGSPKDDGATSKYPDLAIGDGRAQLRSRGRTSATAMTRCICSSGMLSDLSGEIDGRARRVTTRRGNRSAPTSPGMANAWGWPGRTRRSGEHEVYFQSFDGAGMPREVGARVITRHEAWSLVPAIRPWRRICPRRGPSTGRRRARSTTGPAKCSSSRSVVLTP